MSEIRTHGPVSIAVAATDGGFVEMIRALLPEMRATDATLLAMRNISFTAEWQWLGYASQSAMDAAIAVGTLDDQEGTQ